MWPVPAGELTGQWRTPPGPACGPGGGRRPQASATLEYRNRPWLRQRSRTAALRDRLADRQCRWRRAEPWVLGRASPVGWQSNGRVWGLLVTGPAAGAV